MWSRRPSTGSPLSESSCRIDPPESRDRCGRDGADFHHVTLRELEQCPGRITVAVVVEATRLSRFIQADDALWFVLTPVIIALIVGALSGVSTSSRIGPSRVSNDSRHLHADFIVYGHTHKPYTKHVDHVLFVNVGSVGKPKDGDPRACYAILDTTTPAVEFVRVEYHIARVTSAIRQS
jgi:Calcineurin-like phosphoesterase superfamily domain